MSKSILVMDTLDSCEMCKFQIFYGTCRLKDDSPVSDLNECPLKEIPKKIDTRKANTITIENWIDDWNTCINEILKECE